MVMMGVSFIHSDKKSSSGHRCCIPALKNVHFIHIFPYLSFLLIFYLLYSIPNSSTSFILPPLSGRLFYTTDNILLSDGVMGLLYGCLIEALTSGNSCNSIRPLGTGVQINTGAALLGTNLPIAISPGSAGVFLSPKPLESGDISNSSKAA